MCFFFSTAHLPCSGTYIVTPRIFLRVLFIVCNFARCLSSHELASSRPIFDNLYLGWVRRIRPTHCSICSPEIYANHDAMVSVHLRTPALAGSCSTSTHAVGPQLSQSLILSLASTRLSACTRLPSESCDDPKHRKLRRSQPSSLLFSSSRRRCVPVRKRIVEHTPPTLAAERAVEYLSSHLVVNLSLSLR